MTEYCIAFLLWKFVLLLLLLLERKTSLGTPIHENLSRGGTGAWNRHFLQSLEDEPKKEKMRIETGFPKKLKETIIALLLSLARCIYYHAMI